MYLGRKNILIKNDKIRNFKIDELILLYLLNYDHLRDNYMVSESFTEQGIQRIFRYNLGHISRVIKNLEQKELIFRSLRKIENKDRKQNTFFLTEKGLKAASELSKIGDITKIISKENNFTQMHIFEYTE